MNGAVIENLSNRKLFYILIFLLIVQIIFFLVGAWYAPVPSSSMNFEMSKCYDNSKGNNGQWFQIRPKTKRCSMIEELGSFTPSSFDLREIVFVAQMPHARFELTFFFYLSYSQCIFSFLLYLNLNDFRDNVQLEYSPWFQFLLGLLHIEVKYSEHFQYVDNALLQLEVRMGYRTKSDDFGDWHELISTNVSRTLECTISEDKKLKKNTYECNVMDLFEMGSNNYPFYLLNIRIPINQQACR
uniref:Wntless GOLD domain-containing protein n=1 Tax=Heterorhabditis bacteriophora TaxID=37862 RepID=A0A1I7XQR9_HETBA